MFKIKNTLDASFLYLLLYLSFLVTLMLSTLSSEREVVNYGILFCMALKFLLSNLSSTRMHRKRAQWAIDKKHCSNFFVEEYKNSADTCFVYPILVLNFLFAEYFNTFLRWINAFQKSQIKFYKYNNWIIKHEWT